MRTNIAVIYGIQIRIKDTIAQFPNSAEQSRSQVVSIDFGMAAEM
jgi:hypothetical protein